LRVKRAKMCDLHCGTLIAIQCFRHRKGDLRT
jgi:hypothetical protein